MTHLPGGRALAALLALGTALFSPLSPATADVPSEPSPTQISSDPFTN